MLAPTWLTDGLAVAMLAVAAYCASRLVVARVKHRTTHYSFDAVHTAMGVAMAGMLTSHLANTTPWVVVFAVTAGWFGLRAAAGLLGIRAAPITVGPQVRHFVTSGAMVYMLVATPAVAAASTPAAVTMGAGGSARFPTLALLLGIFMVGYTIMVTDRTSRAKSEPKRAEDAAFLAPQTVACCQVAMNITMGYMLVTLL